MNMLETSSLHKGIAGSRHEFVSQQAGRDKLDLLSEVRGWLLTLVLPEGFLPLDSPGPGCGTHSAACLACGLPLEHAPAALCVNNLSALRVLWG